MSGIAPMVRLDRLLGGLGYGSRREIDAMARAGWIELDGQPVVEGASKVPESVDLPERLFIRGRPVDPPRGVCLILHKPLGHTCSHKEAGALVFDLLPARWRRRDPAISTVGRLDKDTSGLLLLTDDGGLLHRIIAPRANVAKRYRVRLARPLEGHEAAALASGTLMLDGEDSPLLPVEMAADSDREVRVLLREGRYHQVRRMFAALGNHVEALHRDRIGALDLSPGLASGQWRIAEAEDIAAVFAPAPVV